MNIRYLFLFLILILFNKVEAKDFDFSKTYVCESPEFRLDFNEEKKTCDLYGIYCCHNNYMGKIECQYFVIGDTLVLYVPKDREPEIVWNNQVPKGEKKRVIIGLSPCFQDTLDCLPPEYRVFVNDSLFVKNSYDTSRVICYDSNFEKDKIVVESNCSRVVSFKDEFYSEGDLLVFFKSCRECIAKLVIRGRKLHAMPAPTLWNSIYNIEYEKLAFKPISKKRLQKWHLKYPIR